MRVIAKKALVKFWEDWPDAEQPLKSWYAEAKAADWADTNDVKDKYGTASFVANNRVVFNIGGNKYRLVVVIHYNTRIVFIRFIGSHSEYDKIDAGSI